MIAELYGGILDGTLVKRPRFTNNIKVPYYSMNNDDYLKEDYVINPITRILVYVYDDTIPIKRDVYKFKYKETIIESL